MWWHCHKFRSKHHCHPGMSNNCCRLLLPRQLPCSEDFRHCCFFELLASRAHTNIHTHSLSLSSWIRPPERPVKNALVAQGMNAISRVVLLACSGRWLSIHVHWQVASLASEPESIHQKPLAKIAIVVRVLLPHVPANTPVSPRQE